MEYWQKFPFITSFSKGLIGYSLRYSEEREAAVCMSGTVDRVQRECREVCRGGGSGGGGGAEDQANRKIHQGGSRGKKRTGLAERPRPERPLAARWEGLEQR